MSNNILLHYLFLQYGENTAYPCTIQRRRFLEPKCNHKAIPAKSYIFPSNAHYGYSILSRYDSTSVCLTQHQIGTENHIIIKIIGTMKE